MTVKSFNRGNLIFYDGEKEEWSKASEKCFKCGGKPTKEGYDNCLGFLGDNVISACCGHGCKKGFIMLKDGRIFEEVNKME